MTQSDLRRALRTRSGGDVAVGTVGRWLYGDRIPTVDYVLQIQKLFGISPLAFKKKARGHFILPALRKKTGTDG